MTQAAINHYRPRHFALQELVDRETFQYRGQDAWELLSVKALITLDTLRDHLGPCIVNTWHSSKLQELMAGQVWQYRGYRPKDCKEGADYSQHRAGNAFDCTFLHQPINKVWSHIEGHLNLYPHLTCIEKGKDVNWLHFDCRNCQSLKIISP